MLHMLALRATANASWLISKLLNSNVYIGKFDPRVKLMVMTNGVAKLCMHSLWKAD